MFTNNQLRLIHKLVTDQIKLIPLYFRDGHKNYYELLTIQKECKVNETMDQNSDKVR